VVREEIAQRPLIREQALGEALDPNKTWQNNLIYKLK
jgi:hypothetical protein